MNQFFKYIFVFLLFESLTFQINAQDQNTQKETDTLSTESVIVIKTFNPTINDAFKIPSTPNLDEKETNVKPSVDYKINSVPVASTFVPEKTKSVEVKKEKPVSQFNNYALLAIGNYINVNAEFFSTMEIDKYSQFSVLLEHLSSQGGIDEVILDDYYYDTDLQLTYSKQSKNLSFSTDMELHHQLYNWYGLPEDLVISNADLTRVEPAHSFIDANIGAQFYLDNDVFKSTKVRFRHFRDDFDSAENNLIIKPEFAVSIDDLDFKIPLVLDFLTGSFSGDFLLPENKYTIFNLGISPSMAIQLQGINIQIGASGFLSNDSENDKLSLYAYPNITANYELPQYNVTVFGGVTGGLEQNTYHKAAEENVYTAPWLNLTPTSQTFNAFTGAKGSFSGSFGYEAQASFVVEKDKPLWLKNAESEIVLIDEDPIPYGLSNSFSYVYDNVTIGKLDVKLSYDQENSFGISLGGTFAAYGVKDQEEAWNLPGIQGNIKGNYSFTPKIKASTELFFIGTRKDVNQITGTTVDVDGYFDANLRVDYKVTDQWQAYITGSNLTGQSYEHWLDYPVQSIQFMLGAKYQF